MRGLVLSATDLSDTSVSGHDDNRGLVTFESSIKEGEALDIKHVDLINEEDTWNDLSTSLLTPLSDLLVNLFSYFGLDLTDITSKQSHEALCSRVDDIYLVKCHGVDDFLTLLELTLGALDKSSLRSDIVEVA